MILRQAQDERRSWRPDGPIARRCEPRGYVIKSPPARPRATRSNAWIPVPCRARDDPVSRVIPYGDDDVWSTGRTRCRARVIPYQVRDDDVWSTG